MSTGQAVGAVVGGVVGFVVGGPSGALYGAQIGMAAGGMLDPPKGPTVHGPRLSDLAIQTSTYGNFIPRVYGTIGIHGNILWLENNQLKETVRKKKQGGKGGGSKTTVKTYSYSGTTILALCQGPIAGVRRIWCMDKLIYNAGSDDLETIIASNQAAAGWKLYLGTDDQMPDPRYEADVGVGNASAFRGIAYLAFYDFQLADYSNTLQAAQFKVEVVSAGESVILPIDETPGISDEFSWLRVFGETGDLHGLRLMDNSKSAYENGTSFASFRVKDFRLGQLMPASGVISISEININDVEIASTARSTDGRNWHQYRSTATFIAGRPYLSTNSEDINGSIILMPTSVSYAQDIIQASEMEVAFGLTQYNFLMSYNGTPGRGRIDRVGVVGVVNNGAEYSFTNTRSEAAGWNVSTAGTSAYEWNISGESDASVKTFNIRIYNNNLDEVVSSFSGDLPAEWPIMTSGSQQVQKVVCRYISGTAYILGKDRFDDGKYRFAVISSNGVQAEYEFASVNAAGEDLCTIWPYDEDQGIALTSNRVVQWRKYSDGGAEVAQIIASEVSLSGVLDTSDIDALLISGTARGYRVNGGTIRAAIEPLQGAFPFDVIQSGYQIKCVPRGQSSVTTIPWEDLGATDGDEPGDILRQSREMDSQLPASTTVTVLDAGREYSVLPQTASRIGTEAVNRVDRELPLVLTADEAAGVAEVLQNLAWLERADLSITLPPTYLPLEGADVVTVTTPQAAYQLRLTEINYTPDGRLECKAKPNRAALYTPNATGGEGVPPAGTVPLAGESIVLLLDIPVVDETLQNDVGFVGVMTGTTDSWPGGLLVRSNDDGQAWADLQGFAGKATIGTARGTLPASSATLIDQRTLTVDLISGELESVTRDQMLSGVNYAAYGVDGRWEIVRFQNATLQGDGSYLISGFVRGEKGTEWATGLHAAGDYFVLLDDPDNIFIGSPVESIGLDRTYRAVTSGASIDSASDVPFTYKGANLECLSPVYAKGARDGSSNFTGTFTRRSRLSSSWWTTGVVAPVGETAEAYEIDVMNGSSVVRTIATSTPSFAYSAASQTTDFGSAQASITFRIYQLSSVVGRGYPLEVTL